MIVVAGTGYPEAADSINPAALTDLPFTPDAYLGYVDGRWPDYTQIAAEAGGKPVYGLTVLGNGQAGQGDDAEPGNITVAQAVTDTIAELARGVDRPVKYCPQSWAAQMVTAHTQKGIDRSRYRLLTAHYQGPTMPGAPIPTMHICGSICGCPVEADGTQWASYPTYDRSLLTPGFITAQPHPGPTTAAPQEDDMPAAEIWNDGASLWLYSANTLLHLGAADEGSDLTNPPATPFTAQPLPYRKVTPDLTAAVPKVAAA